MPLIAHWPLEEDSGSTANDIRGSNDGTINGATLGASGILGKTAYSFDGTDDYVTVSGLDFTADPFAVSLWYKTSTSNDCMVFSQDYASSSHYLYIRFNDVGDVKYRDGGVSDTYSDSAVLNGNWHHIVAQRNSDATSELYFDGGSVISYSTSGIDNGSGDVYIGDWANGLGFPFPGDVADVRIYDHALSATEVQYLYEAVAGTGTLTTQWKSI